MEMNYRKDSMKYIKIVGILLLVVLIYFGYRYLTKKEEPSKEVVTDIEYSDVEEEIDWSKYSISNITLNNDNTAPDVEGVTFEDSTLTITQSGIYKLSGTLEGNIIVEAKDCNVEIILNGVEINSSNGPAIYVKKANIVLITLEDSSKNTLVDSSNYTVDEEEEPNGTIFSKSDLILEGTGSLEIEANYEDGIVSKDLLKINSGTYKITSIGDGIRGKDAVIIKDANITINSECDGIKSTNTSDTNLGYILIENGTFDITSTQDALQAETNIVIQDGTFTIKTGGGSQNAKTNDSWGYWEGNSYTDSDTESAKGIKSGSSISITGGTFDLNTSDDSIHSNGNVAISGGNYTISSGDDGIHADNVLTIENGTTTISKSYEGLEGTEIYIKGGNISINASDDGINAAGGNDTESNEQMMGPRRDNFSSSTGTLYISGGNLYINADGDGLDSNGNTEMTGGYVVVEGPTNAGNGALDYDGTFNISGGTLLAIGSTGMDESPSSSSTQYILHFNVSSKNAGSNIIIEDENGNEIMNYTSSKQYSSIVISTPDIKNNATYTLSIDNTKITDVTTTSIITKYGSSGGMMNGSNPGSMRR